jgi:hypothetical protein
MREDGLAAVDSFSFTLQDHDASILGLAASAKLTTCEVTVTRTINAVPKVIFSGRLNDNIVWEEETYSLQLSADSSYVAGKNIGVVLVDDDIDYMRGDAIGQMIPMPFGCPHKYRTLQITGDLKGTTETVLDEDTTSLTVSGGSNFPQNDEMIVLVGNVGVLGTFNGDVLAVSDVNVALYGGSTITFQNRPTGDTHTMVGYIADADTMALEGKFFYVTKTITVNSVPIVRKAINRCVSQHGTTCVFEKGWCFDDSPGATWAPDSSYTIVEVAGIPRESWGLDYVIDLATDGLKRSANITYTFDDWEIQPGAVVRLPVRGAKHAYSSKTATLLGVYAYRTVDNASVLVPVPSSYFTATTLTVQGETIQVLDFTKSLLERNESWDSTIYVTVSTSQLTPLAALTWLLAEYTDCTVSSTSAVTSLMVNRRSNFCLHESVNVYVAAASIAYQAMLSMSVLGTTAYIEARRRAIVTSSYTLANDNTAMKSISVLFPSARECATKIVAGWNVTEADATQLLTYERATTDYDQSTVNIGINIFDVQPLVQQTVYFYGYRMTDIWRQISCASAIDALGLAVFDVVDTELTDLVGDMNGSVVSATYGDLVQLAVELACAVGSNTEDTNYWTGDPRIAYTGYTGKYPYESAALIDYTVATVNDGGRDRGDKSDKDDKKLTIPLRNDTGVPLTNSYSIVKTDSCIIGKAPGSNDYGVGSAEKPKATDPFLFMPACSEGETVEGVVAGACPCRVDVKDISHKYAKAIDDDCDKLESAESGFGRILWKATEDDGEQWAVVQLWSGGGGGAVTGSARFRVECETVLATANEISLAGSHAAKAVMAAIVPDTVCLNSVDVTAPATIVKDGTINTSLPVCNEAGLATRNRVRITVLKDDGTRDYAYRCPFDKQVTLTFASAGVKGTPNIVTTHSVAKASFAYAYWLPGYQPSINLDAPTNRVVAVNTGHHKYGDADNKIMSGYDLHVTGVTANNSNSINLSGDTLRPIIYNVLYVKWETTTLRFYSNPTMVPEFLVAHSGNEIAGGAYDSYTNHEIVEDNNSGIGGNVYLSLTVINATPAVPMIILAFSQVAPSSSIMAAGRQGSVRNPATTDDNRTLTSPDRYSTDHQFQTNSLGTIPNLLQYISDYCIGIGIEEEDIPTIDCPEYDNSWYKGMWSGYISVTLHSAIYFPTYVDMHHSVGSLLIEATERAPLHVDGYWNVEYESIEDMPTGAAAKLPFVPCANVKPEAGQGYCLVNANPYEPEAWYLEPQTDLTEWAQDLFPSNVDITKPLVLPKTGAGAWMLSGWKGNTYVIVAIIQGHHAALDLTHFPTDLVDGVTDPYACFRQGYESPIKPRLFILQRDLATSAIKYYLETELGVFNSGFIGAPMLSRSHTLWPYSAMLYAWWNCTDAAWVESLTIRKYRDQPSTEGWIENPDHTFYCVLPVSVVEHPGYPPEPACKYMYVCTYDCSMASWGDVGYVDVDSRRDVIDWTVDTIHTDSQGNPFPGLYYCITASATPPSAPTFTPTTYYYYDDTYWCGYGWEGGMPRGCSTTGTETGWAIIYEDECTAYASCVSTSMTPPVNTLTKDCSDCEY